MGSFLFWSWVRIPAQFFYNLYLKILDYFMALVNLAAPNGANQNVPRLWAGGKGAQVNSPSVFKVFSGPITDVIGHMNVIIVGMLAYTAR